MSSYDANWIRSWQEIAKEALDESDRHKLVELAKELNRTLEREEQLRRDGRRPSDKPELAAESGKDPQAA